MAHGHIKLDEADKEPIGAKLWPTYFKLAAAALIGLIVLLVGVAFSGSDWLSRGLFAYLIGYIFVVGLTVGSVALVILTHLFRAGWVVAIRRVPETFAANFWVVGILGLPLLFGVFNGDAPLYPWSASQEVAETNLAKANAFLEELHHAGDHGDARHDDHGGDLDANAAGGDVVYVASDPGNAKEADGHHSGTVELSEAYVEAAHAMTLAGDHYPDDKKQARIVQDMHYTGLLSYMLDYKRYGGALDGDHQVPEGKGFTWLNPMLVVLRLVLYFAVLSLIGRYYWSRSIKQDETGDIELTTKREWWAPASTMAFALMVTFMAFDLIMSLDPAWYSTMFGVIFFANSFTAGIALTILTCMVLQKKGYLKTVNTEHYHDLGKLLFAFVFFWGYVSFSQFMLIWYASLPETTYWFELHGVTTRETAPQYGSGWTYISLAMLFGHLFIPFAFLLSRHVKRNLTALACAATWMLLMVYLDFYWYVMPFFESPGVTFGLPEIGAVLMLLAVVLAAFVRRYARHAPLAHGDPRLHETTALDTNVWAPIHH